MAIQVDFTFSDLIAGYVTSYDSTQDIFGLKTSDGREFKAKLSPMAYAKLIQNFDEGYPDATGSMRSMLTPGRYLFAYGVFILTVISLMPNKSFLLGSRERITFLKNKTGGLSR